MNDGVIVDKCQILPLLVCKDSFHLRGHFIDEFIRVTGIVTMNPISFAT
jgi:hypothetical protein